MPTDPTRAQAVFVAAAEITDPAARASFLAKACGGDLHLMSRVEALLRAHDQPDSLLDAPLVAPPDTDHAATRAFAPDPDHAATRTGGGTPGDAEKDEVTLGFLAPATRPDSLGRIGHYEILQVLGQGAFGIVFRAFDDVLHRIVAVKVLSPQMAATSPARKRFLREARSSAQVRHENVVQAYEVGEHPLPYIVMEFIPGETLQQRLDRTGPIDVAEVVRVGRQIAEGLSAAHANDLIHRDIKPGNILLEGGAQRVKITDFGLARTADDASISQSGIIAGTPMYMAPEQAKGETLDQRADLFSLGSVLYQMVAGRAPFRANGTVAVLKRVAEDTPRSIREITPETPQWLCDIISKLHAKNPDERYQSAREVADVLADCEAQLKANAKLKDFSRIPNVKAATGHRWRWKRAIIIPAAVLLSLVGIWAGPSVWNYTRNRGELKILPGEGLVSVIVLQNDEGVIDGNKLLPSVTDWLDAKKTQALTVPPGKYQLNVGTWPEADLVQEWEVSTSGLLNHSEIRVPVQNTSAIITVGRGQRVTLRPIMRSVPIKTRSNPTPDQVSKQEPPPLAIAPFTDVEVQRIAALPAAEQVEEVRKELMRRNSGFDGEVRNLIEGGVVTESRIVTDQVTDIAPVRVFNALRLLECRGTNTNFKADGIQADLTPLKEMNLAGLTHLDLTDTNATDAGMVCFKDCKDLTYLDLTNTKVADTGLAHFKDSKNLIYLQLINTQVSDAGLVHIQDCKALTHLNLAGTKVTDTGLAHFKDSKNLTYLHLDRMQVGDAGLIHFKDCKNLTSLNLSYTRVSDAGLAHFKNCKNLTSLHLKSTRVTDVGLADLAGLDQLTELNLANTKVTAKAVEGLAKALPKCKITWDGGVIEPK